MQHHTCLFFIALLLFGACQTTEKKDGSALYFQLELIDSIQVAYLGNPRTFDFINGKGAFFDMAANELVLFNETGEILKQVSYPEEGPGALRWVLSMRFHPSGQIFAYSLSGEMYRLNPDLEILEKLPMEFASQMRDGPYHTRAFDFYKEDLLLFYPGREGQNPYLEDFWKNNSLLEYYSLEKKEMQPFLTLFPESQHLGELFYENPRVVMGIAGDLLYLSLDTETLIGVYDLQAGGAHQQTLDFQPDKYVQLEGAKARVGYVSGNFMSRGRMLNLFALNEGPLIYYSEGIEKDDFLNAGLNQKENWYKIPDMEKRLLRLYRKEVGWSNEIVVPAQVKTILNIEGLDQVFYGLRDDDYLGEEQEYLTFYKMKLRPVIEP
ncbi:MAG: hypothetical protein ACXIT9_02925 [Nitritalea sp.]